MQENMFFHRMTPSKWRKSSFIQNKYKPVKSPQLHTSTGGGR